MISVSSVRPCDTAELARVIGDIPQVISVEEHNVNGGVGSLVAEVIAENGLRARLKRLGVTDGGYAIAGDRQSTRVGRGIGGASGRDTAAALGNAANHG